MSKVFVLSDIHFPFHDKGAFKEAINQIKKSRPNVVIQIGDLFDQYVFSKYSRSLQITTETDVLKARKQAEEMWAEIKRILPRADCIQVLGNHDVRMAKRVAERLPELEGILNPLDLYKFPKVRTLKSDREYLVIDGVVYCHGWLSKSIDHAVHFGKPTVHGHRHRPGIETKGNLWSMDVGFLADQRQLPLKYTPSTVTNWGLACGEVDNRKPRLIII